jgi:hypothetical protein
MADIAQVDHILDLVTAWGRSRSDISGLAVVGSWARGTARPASDIDLILLVCDPHAFRSDTLWLRDLRWGEDDVVDWLDVEYGRAWSRHVRLKSSREIEFTFCGPEWSATEPVDPGTAEIVSTGCWILLDKFRLFKNLLVAVSP